MSVSVRIDSDVTELADVCGDVSDFVAQDECESELIEKAVLDFFGTPFALCVAHEELARGIARDCWSAARIVGKAAATSSLVSFRELWRMCPAGVCGDGCRHGVLLGWGGAHYAADEFVDEARAVCDRVGEQSESCWGGLGAGLVREQARLMRETAGVQTDHDHDGGTIEAALRAVQRECEDLVDELDSQAKRERAGEWCVEGAVREWVWESMHKLDDEA